MKTKVLNLMVVALFAIFTVSSCSDDPKSNNAPEFEGITFSADNKTATVTFTEAVYANNDKTGNLTANDILLTIDGVDFTYEVEHTAGAANLIINLVITSAVNGDEAVALKANVDNVFDAEGLPMAADQMLSASGLTQDLGIVGMWESTGDNVAPLLVQYFSAKAVYAEFKEDGTYYVEQFNEGNESDVADVTFDGTFAMVKSEVDNIWTITLTQANPYAAEVSGIFEIKTDTGVLWYEVVQTSGTQNVPPTAADGFGSTSGGAFGETNIQKYVRVTE